MTTEQEQRLRELIDEVAVRASASTHTTEWELEPREAIVAFVRGLVESAKKEHLNYEP